MTDCEKTPRRVSTFARVAAQPRQSRTESFPDSRLILMQEVQ